MRIGIDLGGTKIEAVVLAESGEVAARRRVPTPAGDYAGTLDAIVGLVNGLESEVAARCSIGIGTPGSVSRRNAGRMKNCNSVCLNGRALSADLAQQLQRPVRVANDADCLAVSESTDGAAAGASPVFAVILGTGVGGGLTVGGRLVQGADGNTGEWGHNPIPATASAGAETPRPCYCGRVDCVETWLSGAGLVQSARAAGLDVASAKELARRAGGNDAPARQVLAHYQAQLAAALAVVINIIDPEVIVIGGGLSHLPDLCAGVQSALAPHVFSDRVAVDLRVARHGDASGVRGAAWLWPPPTKGSE